MVFDKLCGLVERIPEFLPFKSLVEQSRMFVFPGRAHDILPKELPEASWLSEYFCLPFNTVAIEDTASVVILSDSYKGQIGITSRRYWIEAMRLDTSPEEFADSKGEITVNNKLHDQYSDCLFVSSGTIDTFKSNNRVDYDITGSIIGFYVANKSGIQLNTKQVISKFNGQVIDGPLKNAGVALQEVMYFNTPNKFIVEIAPANYNKVKNKKILRTEHRPQYTLLSPAEIKKTIKSESTDKRESPIAHERRRHYRTYPDDPNKWPNAHGKTVIIPARWVGITEKTIGNKKYKIRLDL